MKKLMLSELRISLFATVSFAFIMCGLYPLAVWAIAQGLFPYQANGSLLLKDGRIIGSQLLAQNFTDPKYFHPRPSSAGPTGYDGTNSGGSNFGPTSRELILVVQQRVKAYRDENNLSPEVPVPPDAVTASASGLDPHITLRNAELQAGRVARQRGLNEGELVTKIRAHTKGRVLGIFGEPTVNVLQLNLALEAQ
jgi:potassium-transporting ATPase KdpC subunit